MRRAGTAGDEPAPDAYDELITGTDAARARGIAELATGGNQEIVTLNLPLFSEATAPDLIEPAMLCEVRDIDGTWRGLCLATEIGAEGVGGPRHSDRPPGAPSLRRVMAITNLRKEFIGLLPGGVRAVGSVSAVGITSDYG